jgi:hypothetical protein
VVKIEVLQYFKSRKRFGKFSQTYLLKVGAKSLESRGEVDFASWLLDLQREAGSILGK